jgi:EAL domain-containing protein (putative c-di-GMP-specific phosphodiesterase class I)/DNA-binding response OmpR family regulator
VLIVDDEHSIRVMVRRVMEREGFVVVEAANGAEALQVAHDHVDVVLLDLGLPDMSGLELLTDLRRMDPSLHVIIVSGAGSEVERVQGLVRGADDYMVKPVSIRELTARVAAVGRRRQSAPAPAAAEPASSPPEAIEFGGLVLEPTSRTVTLAGEPVEFTRREFDLLSYLVTNAGRTITREELLEAVWSSSGEWQSSSTVTEHVHRLRAKLGSDPTSALAITTVRGSGYRMELPAGSADPSDPDGGDGRGEGDPARAPHESPRVGVGPPPPALESEAEASVASASLVADIRRGLEADEFEVFYQPVVRLEDRTVVSVEALMRWRHPDLGLLSPASFIEAAEESGLIVELGRHVLDTACHQLGRWRAEGHPLDLSVNLSAPQLVDVSLPEKVEAAMAANELPPGSLWLEVTETSLVGDVGRAAAVLERTDRIGARMLVDDFGTGWSGLTYLRHFPVRAIKIDRAFVAGVGIRDGDEAIVRWILSLGRELGLPVTAEGIETEAQRAMLLELDCSTGQGYLFARPAPAALVVLPQLH